MNQGNWTFGHHSQGTLFAVTSALDWKPDSFWSIYQIDDDRSLSDRGGGGTLAMPSTDLDERIELSHRAQTIFLEQQLTIFGWHTPRFNVITPNVEGMLFECWTHSAIPQGLA